MPVLADSLSSRRAMTALVAFGSLLVYANTLWGGFVFDDGHIILNNEWITDFSYIGEIFVSSAWGFEGAGSSNYYRPLYHVLLMFDYHLFGLSPWGYHLVNIVIHAINSILVLLLALYLFGIRKVDQEEEGALNGNHLALAAALLFALHPVHVEAVAWVSAISELAFTLFFLLSLYLYIMADEKKGRGALVLSWLFFIVALLFKETAVMLIFAIVAFDLCSFKLREWSRSWIGLFVKRYLAYVIILSAYIIVKLVVSGGLVPRIQHEELSLFQYFINIFPLIMDYLRLVFFPVSLNAYYIFHPVLSVLDLRFIASIIVIIPFCVLFVINIKRRDRAASSAWLLALLTIMPALYIAGAGTRGSAFAERYLYLPSAGFFIFIIYWLASFLRRFAPRRAATLFVVILVFVCTASAAGTVLRNRVWKDNYSLWKDSAQKTLDSELVYVNLGSAADSRGLRAEALDAYERALKINPKSAEVHNNLGVFYFETKEYELSLKNYEEALKETTTKRNRVLINENMGNIYYSMGRFTNAVERYQLAIEIEGGGAEAKLFNKLGISLARSGRVDEARESFKRVLEINPSHVGAKKNLSRIEASVLK